MSKGYWIVRVSVDNPDGFTAYQDAAKPVFKKFGANFLVRGGEYESKEGNPRARNVVIEFKDVATAKACYNSPEYQAARSIRFENAAADLIIIEGLAA